MKKSIHFLLALSVLFLSSCGFGGDRVKVKDVLCPYVIESQEDGSLRVEVDTGALPGYVWQYELTWGDICQAEVTQQQNSVVITLTGLTPGAEEVSFLCVKEGDEPEYRFQINIQVNVDGENKVSLQAYDNKELTGNGSAGENTEFPYSWTTDKDGKMTLFVTCEEQIDWVYDSSENEAFVLENLVYDWEGCILQLVPQAAGEGVVVMKNEKTGQELPFKITVDDTLVMTVQLETAADAGTAANG